MVSESDTQLISIYNIVSQMLSEPSSWFTLHQNQIFLIEIGLAVIGIIIALALYLRVGSIEKKRRNEQKTHFKKLVINNLEEVLDIYNLISPIAHRTQLTEEELEEKTKALHQIFKKKNEDLIRLVRDTKFYASMLSVVDTPTIDMREVIEKIEFLTKDFYMIDNSIDRNKRHWIEKEQELQDNRDFIENSLASLNKA